MRHGPRDFCRVKEIFSAHVPKNLGGPRPPQEVGSARLKRGPRSETGVIFVPRVLALINDHENEGSWFKNKLLGRAKKDLASRNPGKICFWSNDATDMLIDLWSEETIQFALESSKTSKAERERYIARFR